jgi:hypothetical protein
MREWMQPSRWRPGERREEERVEAREELCLGLPLQGRAAELGIGSLARDLQRPDIQLRGAPVPNSGGRRGGRPQLRRTVGQRWGRFDFDFLICGLTW